MSPLFSVVIPTYNSASKVTHAIKSVLAQKFKDYEIWVIDDGSTDNTQTALQPFADQIHYHYQENQGAAAARNQGITHARGTYVAFLDADDWWYPQKLARVAEAIPTWPDTGLFYSQVDFLNAAGEKLWTYRSEDRGTSNYLTLLKRDFVMTSSTVVKKTCFTEVGTFDITLSRCQDWDMWIRITRNYPIHLIAEPLSAYAYMAAGSLTANTTRWIQAHDQLLKKIMTDDPHLTPAYQRQIRSAFAYRKGKIYLAAREDHPALQEFRKALTHHWRNWQAWPYWFLLKYPFIRQYLLPTRIKHALRLPEMQT